MTIPFIDLKAQQERIKPQIEAAIARVLAHGQYILGPEVTLFEQRLAEFCGARHVLSCASGTDALILPLMAKGIGSGDAVFVPSFTFVAAAEVVVLLGATPMFVDVDPKTYLMDTRQFSSTYIDDIVEGVIRVIDRPAQPEPDWSGDSPDSATSYAPYRVYNIGNNQPVELLRYIEVLENCLGRKANKELLPMQEGDVPVTYADTDDLERDVGFRPRTPVETGVLRFVEWYKDYYGVD